jgi:predicted nucleic-acid-binding protein
MTTGLDTNVLVRFSIRDDEKQTKAATALINSLSINNKGFVSLPVLLEYIWVLDSVYDQSKESIRKGLMQLLTSSKIVIQCADEVESALAANPDADFADAIIAEIGRSFGCSTTMTFDKKAARLKDMELLS